MVETSYFIAPEPGQTVKVRNRPAIVKDVESFLGDLQPEKLNLVHIEYIDDWGHPAEDKIIWEREIQPEILSQIKFPAIEQWRPDLFPRFQSFINGVRWSSLNGLVLKSSNKIQYLLTSPWYSAVQIEDYQLYPVLKAIQMPRVRMLLADDVGLGKTIEAGLIATELINQRRIRRILVVCPSSLQIQWQDELRDKFNLNFTLLDSEGVFQTQKEYGMDVNPWLIYPKIITSIDYLKQPDIIQKFVLGTNKLKKGSSAKLPWDLIIVDEAHNCFPSDRGTSYDSERAIMLREVSKYFEHRLFLTATPHNGNTTSLSGLLEILDPLRFTQKTELTNEDILQLDVAMVRRLKSDLNKRDIVKRFSDREVKSIEINFTTKELDLFKELKNYKDYGNKLLEKQELKNKQIWFFTFSLLNKRLLSSIYAFGRTWIHHLEGFKSEKATIEIVEESKKEAEKFITNDIEKTRREQDLTRHFSAWLKDNEPELRPYIDKINNVLNGLGWKLDDFTKEMSEFAKFPEDSKFSALDNRIKELLYENGSFKKEERLIIFTEYKDTQAYITRQLELKKLEEPVVQLLYGGAPSEQRMKIKTNFNDLKSPLKILIATDAASEGLNLQSACRFIIHYEIPWNPTRLEQRNGRVDRHGQSKQVIISHFTSKNDEDHEFLSKIVFKVNTIREDLGSFGDVIDIEIIKHFNKKDPDTFEVVEQELSKIASQDERLKLLKTDTKINYHDAYQQLLNSQEQLNLHPDTLRDILAETLKLDGGNIECKTMEDSEKKHTFSYCLITDPIPANWEELIKKSLRKDSALLKLVFNPDSLELRENEIRIFRIPNDVAYIKLSHPIIKRSVNTIQRSLWESSDNPKNNKISRWTINKLNMSKRLGQILVLYYSVTCYNNLGEIADNMVSEEPFIIDRTGLTSLDLKLWSNIKNEEKITLSNQELDSWKKQLLPLWSQFRKLLNEYIDQKTNEKKQYYNDLFLESKNYFADLEKRILNDRLKDLELENNPKPTKSKNLLANYKQKNLLYFLEEHLQQIKVESFTDDIVWERDEKTLELLKEYLKSENKRILEEVLPKRYSVKRIDIRPIGIEILVDV